MLDKNKAERLAAEVLATERAKRPPRSPRPRHMLWFMWLWRRLCPGLNQLSPDVAAEVVHEALGKTNRNPYFIVLYVALAAMNFIYVDRRLVPAILVLLLYVLCLVMYAWLVRRGIRRRLPEALARQSTALD